MKDDAEVAMNESPSHLVNEISRGWAFRWASEVEAELLAGCNRLVVENEFAGITMGRTIYEVPRWRDRPVARLKIARLRRRYRRRTERPRD